LHWCHTTTILRTCIGNPDLHLVSAAVKSRIGAIDSKGVWRHKLCTLITTTGDRCPYCRRLRKSFQTAAARRKFSRSKFKSNCTHTVRRLKTRVHTFRLLAAHLKRKLKCANQQKLRDEIAKFPTNQRMAVEHCMHQIRAKSARGMRYDQQWILSCIMLHIKSPKAYRHLRDNGYLSLPSRSTLQRYIDVIRAEPGIATDVIKHMSSKVQSPCESERHGILMFDEIKLCEGISFNTKAMEFEGYVDFGEFCSKQQSNSPADTGLVLSPLTISLTFYLQTLFTEYTCNRKYNRKSFIEVIVRHVHHNISKSVLLKTGRTRTVRFGTVRFVTVRT